VLFTLADSTFLRQRLEQRLMNPTIEGCQLQPLFQVAEQVFAG
jgi:hypothetical protein